jgi:hypothetical protein
MNVSQDCKYFKAATREGGGCFILQQDGEKWWVVVTVAMNIRFPSNSGNLLTSFSPRTVLNADICSDGPTHI